MLEVIDMAIGEISNMLDRSALRISAGISSEPIMAANTNTPYQASWYEVSLNFRLI